MFRGPHMLKICFIGQQLEYFCHPDGRRFWKYLHNSKCFVKWPFGFFKVCQAFILWKKNGCLALCLECNGNTWEAQIGASFDHLLPQLRNTSSCSNNNNNNMQTWKCACRHLWPLTHLMKLAMLDSSASRLFSSHRCVSGSELPSTDGSSSGSDRFICSPKQSCRHQPPDRWHQNPISVV